MSHFHCCNVGVTIHSYGNHHSNQYTIVYHNQFASLWCVNLYYCNINCCIQVQKLQETIDLQKAQRFAQGDQTKQVRGLLTQATTELDILRLEKKQILQQWNSSLVGMQRRDEALAGIHKVKRDNQDKLNTMCTEMSSYKRSIKQTQEKNELLTGE